MELQSKVWTPTNPGTKHVYMCAFRFPSEKMLVDACGGLKSSSVVVNTFHPILSTGLSVIFASITFRQKLLVMNWGFLLVKQILQICRKKSLPALLSFTFSHPLLSSVHRGPCSQGWLLKPCCFPLHHEPLLCFFSPRLDYLRRCWSDWSKFVGFVGFFPFLIFHRNG